MGKAKRFNSYDSDVDQQRKLVKSYGLARQNNSVSAFRSMPMSPPTATNTDNESVVSGDNLGNHIATQDLEMGCNQITGFAGLDQTTANSTGAINLINNSSIRWKDSAGTGEGVFKFDSSNNFLFDNDIDIQGKSLILDQDGDTSISSFSDDSIQIGTGGSVRLAISNSAIISAVNLSTLGNLQVDGNTILGDSAGDSITINGLVNWNTNYSAISQTAGNSTGYITILIGGSAKKLYYY